MSDPIVSFDEAAMRGELRELVRRTVEDTLNALLEEEADDLIGADRYERTAGREAYRAGHYERGLTTTSGQVTLRMPKLKGMRFATAIIERYKRREASVEEAMIEMYLAGVSTRRIEDVSEILWGASVSSATVSNLNEKAFEAVEEWRSRPLNRKYPYVFVDGIYLKRSWGGSFENVAVMVAIGVNDDGYREVIGAAEGFTESAECWREFLSWLKGARRPDHRRGIQGLLVRRRAAVQPEGLLRADAGHEGADLASLPCAYVRVLGRRAGADRLRQPQDRRHQAPARGRDRAQRRLRGARRALHDRHHARPGEKAQAEGVGGGDRPGRGHMGDSPAP